MQCISEIYDLPGEDQIFGINALQSRWINFIQTSKA